MIEKGKPSEKFILVEQELYGIDRDDFVNLDDLLRLLLINGECRNPKVVADGGELTKNINQKKKLTILQACRCPFCHKGESITSISVWNIVNHLGKYDFSWESVVNNLKERQIFSNQMNINCLDLILARPSWNCSTVGYLRCLNPVLNETI